MQQTSLQAYWSLNPQRIGRRQQQVFEAIDLLAPATDKEISDQTGLPINVVTPRRGELAKRNLITVAYVKRAANGRPATYWKVTEPNIPSIREYRAGLREAQ